MPIERCSPSDSAVDHPCSPHLIEYSTAICCQNVIKHTAPLRGMEFAVLFCAESFAQS